MYQDTLLSCIEIFDGRADFTHLLNRSLRYKRRGLTEGMKRLSEFEVFMKPLENDEGSEAATYEFADEFQSRRLYHRKEKSRSTAIDRLSPEKCGRNNDGNRCYVLGSPETNSDGNREGIRSSPFESNTRSNPPGSEV
jgi:hypothetical protein